MPQVMLVDDNEQLRECIEMALDQEPGGYTTLHAGDGETAIEILTESYENVDVIVLDVQMPVTNGWEALRVIKDPEDGFPGPAVIMLTGSDTPENALKSWVLGADYFMTKPVELSQLIQVIKQAAAS